MEVLPLRLRPDYPENIEAWQRLFRYPFRDVQPAHLAELARARQKKMRDLGDGYPSWVLDRIGVETMLANRIALGKGLRAPRFRWVWFVDALLFPLNNSSAKARNPDLKAFMGNEETLLQRYVSESGLSTLPRSFDEYLVKLVTATVERQRAQGAVAIKFEAAYLRSLDFAEATKSDAAGVYEHYAGAGEPSPAAYKQLQDYLFRYIARDAGRLGMAVHLHVTGGGYGAYYDAAAATRCY